MTILGTGSVLPGRPITTAEICAQAYPGRDPAELEAKTGIHTRYFHKGTETVASLAARALDQALKAAGLPASALKRIILVTGLGGDHALPSTVNIVAYKLGLRRSCDGFDMSNGCLGFLSALDVAARCTATGIEPIGLVSAELTSNRIDPKYPRTYVLFGDGSGAAILARGDGSSGVLSSHFGNDGALGTSVTLAHQRPLEEKEVIRFGASNDQITQEAMEAVIHAADSALKDAAVRSEEIDWFVVHQPNGVMFRKMAEALRAPADRLLPIVGEVGNLGSAAIAVSLDRLHRHPRFARGQLALFAGVGTGLAYGAMVMRL